MSCKNVTFTFTYAGTAKYTEVYATSTAVSSSINPSNVGQAVTYTATITATVGANQDPLPNSPTGTVTFKDGSTTICSNVAIVERFDDDGDRDLLAGRVHRRRHAPDHGDLHERRRQLLTPRRRH